MNKQCGAVFVLLIGTTVCFTLVISRAAETPSKLPPPDAQAQVTALRNLEDVYGANLKAARTPEDKSALARKLLSDGNDTAEDSIGRYVIFNKAIEVAASSDTVHSFL
jgi:hypothetical protein